MVDLVPVEADVQASNKGLTNSQRGIAGGSITPPMPLYRDATDGKLKPAQGTTAVLADCVGVAAHAAEEDQPITFVDDDPDFDPGVVVTVGETYVVSANAAGGIAPISDLGVGDFPTILGIATAVDKLPIRITASGVAKA